VFKTVQNVQNMFKPVKTCSKVSKMFKSSKNMFKRV